MTDCNTWNEYDCKTENSIDCKTWNEYDCKTASETDGKTESETEEANGPSFSTEFVPLIKGACNNYHEVDDFSLAAC